MQVFKNYGLSIVLALLFLLSWGGQSYFQWQEYVSNQQEHGVEADLPGFIPEFMSATFENWQSEFLQLLSFVVLATYLIHKDSPQSRDGDDRMEAKLDQILASSYI
jgi:hypothetical protein